MVLTKLLALAFVILSWVESRGHMQHLGKAGLGGKGCQPTAKVREIQLFNVLD